MQIDDTYNPRLLGSYREFVGREDYDETSKMIFDHLIEEGLSEDMRFLDMGAGSLRVGRWLIPFLLAGKYVAVEPEESMLRIGIRQNLPSRLLEYKKPQFFNNSDFTAQGSFDMALAWNVFIHCGKEQLKQCLGGSQVQTWLLTIAIGPTERCRVKTDKAKTEEGRLNHSYRFASHAYWQYIQKEFEDLCASYGYSAEKTKYLGPGNYVWRLDRKA